MADDKKAELTEGRRLALLEEKVKLYDACQGRHLKAITVIFFRR
jgi:hypothetical protein